jgi:hypothetical protein
MKICYDLLFYKKICIYIKFQLSLSSCLGYTLRYLRLDALPMIQPSSSNNLLSYKYTCRSSQGQQNAHIPHGKQIMKQNITLIIPHDAHAVCAKNEK